ncbi:MAG: hypothetical protein ACLR09_05040 [Gallintestinimicrobium sp.]
MEEADYTSASWKSMQSALAAAKTALNAKESQTAVDAAKDALTAAVKGLEKAPAATPAPSEPATPTPDATPTVTPTVTPSEQVSYVLMNIPYDKFYAAELNNSVSVDVFSSATKSKTKTGSLAGGSYHSNADGSSIDGITFPVKVSGIDLSKYKKSNG